MSDSAGSDLKITFFDRMVNNLQEDEEIYFYKIEIL